MPRAYPGSMDQPAAVVPPKLPTSAVRARLRGVLRDRTFASLQVPDYRKYFFGQVISLTGTWMQSTALLWLAYAQTRDPLWPAAMLVAQTVPTILLGAYTGALADRLPKRKLVVATQMAYLTSAGILALLVASGHAVPGVLLAAQLVNGTIQAVDLPARLSYVPSLVPRTVLANAVALNSMIFNAARAVGPALAGGLLVLARLSVDRGVTPFSNVAVLGASWCVTLNALSYFVVIGALLRIHAPGNPVANVRHRAGLTAGIRAVAADRTLAGFLIGAGLLSASAWPVIALFSAYAVEVLGHAEGEYSLLVSALGVGALTAAMGNATFASPNRVRQFLVGGAAMAATGLAGLALAPALGPANLLGAVTSAALLGGGLVLHLSTAQTALQLSVADHTRGRVMALWPITLSVGTLAGNLVTGSLAHTLGVRGVVAGMAIAATAVTLGRVRWFVRESRIERDTAG